MHRSNPLASLIRIALVGLTLTIAAASVDAAPRKTTTTTEEAAVKQQLKDARVRTKAAKARIRALKAKTRLAKALEKAEDAEFEATCIEERTGPVGGLLIEDAAIQCADALAARKEQRAGN
jgi:hypothetical protein